VISVLTLVLAGLSTETWPQFRGPAGNGHVADAEIPLRWSEEEGVVWKSEVPGQGWSTPVIADEQVWLTTASEDGEELAVLSFDLLSGDLLEDILVFDVEDPQEIHPLNSYASPSPVIEGERLYVHFGRYGTACLDTMSGEVVWERRDILCEHGVGPGSSLYLLGDLLYFPMDGMDVQYVMALDKDTGETVWKRPRSTDYGNLSGDMRKAYSTAFSIEVDGRRQLIASGAQSTFAYDPLSGEEIWKVKHPGFSMSSIPVTDGKRVYLPTAFNNPELWAVRLGGKGDISETHVDWRVRRNAPTMPSLLHLDGLLYMVNDGGIATCLEAENGEVLWRQRLTAEFSASPLYASGRIYFFDREGQCTVIQPGREYQELASNQLDDGCMASPVVVGDALVLRTRRHLYRIETPANSAQEGS
jgi:outer membrane protein assembly factor BamB